MARPKRRYIQNIQEKLSRRRYIRAEAYGTAYIGSDGRLWESDGKFRTWLVVGVRVAQIDGESELQFLYKKRRKRI
jgi:hypothetical protein